MDCPVGRATHCAINVSVSGASGRQHYRAVRWYQSIIQSSTDHDQGRVMLPMRAIFESLGASVKWNQKTQTVTANRDGTTIVLQINNKTATINGQTVSLDVPAKNVKGNTMIPVRFASEALGEKIGWNSRTKTVTITTSKPAPPQPITFQHRQT